MICDSSPCVITLIFLFFLFSANATLEAPVNPEVDTVDSSTIRVSWEPPPGPGPYTYGIALFNGSTIFYLSVGSDTSKRITGLKHLSNYVVFVIALSGDQYSAAYRIHLVEACKEV